jgi:membrane protease YdiL (CAAX protease family)
METTFAALVAYGVYGLVSGLALVALVATQGSAALPPVGAQAIPSGPECISGIAGSAATIVVLWVAIRMARRDFSEYLALNWPTRDEVMAAFMIAIMLWIAQIVVSSLISPAVPSTGTHLSFSSNGELLILFVAICVVAPIVEEFTFRGFIFRGWSESFVGPTATIVLTAAIWAACHTQYDWWARGWIFLSGLALGYFRWRNNSTWLAVIVHSGMNLSFFLTMRVV